MFSGPHCYSPSHANRVSFISVRFVFLFPKPRLPASGESGPAPPDQRPAAERSEANPPEVSGSFLIVRLSRLWTGWRSALVIVRPETVIAWHRRGFRLYWTWKSRNVRPGRPDIPRKVRDLIRNMSLANPLWGAPRIHGELLKLGIELSQATVAKYMALQRKPPSQTWRTFLENHVQQLVSADFFIVPTVTFRVLYVFIVLAHERRRLLHFNVTAHPNFRMDGATDG